METNSCKPEITETKTSPLKSSHSKGNKMKSFQSCKKCRATGEKMDEADAKLRVCGGTTSCNLKTEKRVVFLKQQVEKQTEIESKKSSSTCRTCSCYLHCFPLSSKQKTFLYGEIQTRVLYFTKKKYVKTKKIRKDNFIPHVFGSAHISKNIWWKLSH